MPSIRKVSRASSSRVPEYIYGAGCAWHVMTCESTLVHQSTCGKGKGAERMLMLLSPCSAAQVMGLEGCVGVHSTSRPPQKDLSFPQLPLIVGLRYVGIGLHTSFFACIVALLVEG